MVKGEQRVWVPKNFVDKISDFQRLSGSSKVKSCEVIGDIAPKINSVEIIRLPKSKRKIMKIKFEKEFNL